MVIRGGRNLDLARGREPPIHRQHLAHDLALLLAHAALVGQREVAPAPHPFAHLRVLGLELLVEPGELRPHLQVAKILRAEQIPRPRALLPLPRAVQLAVARVAVDHALRIGVEGVLQQECAVRIGEILGRLEGRLEKRIRGLARGVLRHLRHHRRDQVERLPDFRKLLQNPRHAVVVLEGVHARPRQLVLAGRPGPCKKAGACATESTNRCAPWSSYRPK